MVADERGSWTALHSAGLVLANERVWRVGHAKVNPDSGISVMAQGPRSMMLSGGLPAQGTNPACRDDIDRDDRGWPQPRCHGHGTVPEPRRQPLTITRDTYA